MSDRFKFRLLIWLLTVQREVLLLAAAAVKVLKRLKVLQ